MRNSVLPQPDEQDLRVSRRRFLRQATAYGTAAWAASELGLARSLAQTPSAPGSSDSRVVELIMRGVTEGRRVHSVMVGEMLETSIRIAADVTRSGEAWRKWLTDDDIIAIKFNRSGQGPIGTTGAMARAIVTSLRNADFSPERIMLLEVPDALAADLGTRRPPSGWSETIHEFPSGRDEFLAALDEASAVINVPFLKTHNIAGMTGCLKNLSHGLIKHPARYHSGRCSPFIGDIVGCSAIGPKLKLNIIDGLRVMFEQGPRAPEEFVTRANLMIVSTDPVAADSAGLVWLNRVRKTRELPPVGGKNGEIPYLAAAERSGVGTYNLDHINLDFIEL